MFTDLRDLNALTFSNTIWRKLLLEGPWYLLGLMLRISELTLRARQHLNLSQVGELLFAAVLGFVLFLLIYLMRSIYRFERSNISSNNRTYRRRYFRGKIWSRRKVLWRQMNISRSTFIMLAQQRLFYDRETGEFHVGSVSSASNKGTETVKCYVTDRSQGHGKCERQPVGSVSSACCQGASHSSRARWI